MTSDKLMTDIKGRQTHWVTLSFRNTKVLHQNLNPTAKLRCKTLSRIMFGIKSIWFYTELKLSRFIFVCLFKSIMPIWCYLSWTLFKSGFTPKFCVILV